MMSSRCLLGIDGLLMVVQNEAEWNQTVQFMSAKLRKELAELGDQQKLVFHH